MVGTALKRAATITPSAMTTSSAKCLTTRQTSLAGQPLPSGIATCEADQAAYVMYGIESLCLLLLTTEVSYLFGYVILRQSSCHC